MNAREVLNRYAAGERDFRRADLRGQSFQGQDLAGADFSEADIRGTNFNNANLQEANFTGAKAGVQKRWLMSQTIGAFLLAVILNFTSAILNSVFLYIFLTPDAINQVTAIPGITILLINIVIIFAIARQGFTARAASTIGITVAVAVAGAVAVAVAVAVAGAGAGAVAGAGAGAGAVAGAVAVAVAGAVTGASLLLGLYCSRRALKGDEKFALLRSFGIAFAALGGTSFCGANLTAANFSRASLKGSNFQASRRQSTCLDLVSWKDSHQLDRARVGDSILAAAAVRDLLVSHNGSHQSYLNANLSGAHLAGANLQQANLKGANLSGANLEQADLRHANLTQTLALGTNFRHAHLTAACLEAWNIDHTTQLVDVDCDYVYFLETPNALGSRERRPHDPDQIFPSSDGVCVRFHER